MNGKDIEDNNSGDYIQWCGRVKNLNFNNPYSGDTNNILDKLDKVQNPLVEQIEDNLIDEKIEIYIQEGWLR